MRIVEFYSHLNGYEYLLVHKPHIWREVEEAIASIDAEACRTKQSKEARRSHAVLYSPIDLNVAFHDILGPLGWTSRTTSNWTCADSQLLRRIVRDPPGEQKQAIDDAGFEAIRTTNQTDFVKERVAVEVQLGKYSFVAHDLFVKHMAFFVNEDIDVGIEIVPMKDLERNMSSGVPYYERDLFNLIRQGRSTPAVPLVLVGIAP